MIGSRINIQHILNQQFPEQQKNITLIKPIFKKNQYHILFSKQQPEHESIIRNFNRAFKQMRQEGVIDSIRRKHNLDREVLPLANNEKVRL